MSRPNEGRNGRNDEPTSCYANYGMYGIICASCGFRNACKSKESIRINFSSEDKEFISIRPNDEGRFYKINKKVLDSDYTKSLVT